MARFLALSPRILLLVAAGSLLPGLTVLRAAPPATTSTNTPPPNAHPPVPAAANTHKPPQPPPLPPNTFNQYGNILQAGNEPAHPLKLDLPFPGVGEIKIPNPNELTMREKLEQLASLNDDQIREQLAKWPPFTKMSLRDEGMMLARIQDFREYRARTAQQAAHNLGLSTLTPQQMAKFEQEYWNKRLPMERQLVNQLNPIIQHQEQAFNEQLYREFSAVPGVLAQNQPPPKPGAPATTTSNNPPNKPATTSPSAQNKPGTPAPASTAQNGANKPATGKKPASATSSNQAMQVGADQQMMH